jgi:hypothetical protein
MSSAIAIQPSLARERNDTLAKLTLSGRGNALLMHLGALHRLHELAYLEGMEILGLDSSFTPDERKLLDNWHKRAKGGINKSGSLAEVFGTPLRALREESFWSKWWRSNGECNMRLDDCYATFSLSCKDDVSWSAKDTLENDGLSLPVSAERRAEMKKLVLSPQCLPDIGMDYLIDWGYVLCDAALSHKGIGIAPMDWPYASPNRIFYRSFGQVRNASTAFSSGSGVQADTTTVSTHADVNAA